MNLPALYTEAWVRPRDSMRRILSLGMTERDRLIMVAITGVLFAIPITLIFRMIEMPTGPDGEIVPRPNALMVTFTTVALVIIGYYITAALIKVIGGLFGGTATYIDSKTASAWTQFVVGIANLVLLMLSFILPSALEYVLRLAFTLAALYVSSAYIAEVHGFASTGKVMAASIVVMVAVLLALASLMQAGSALPPLQ